MTSRLPYLALALCAAATPLAVAGQQTIVQNLPRAGYVYPAGGQQGTKVRVVVGGQFLNGAFESEVSGRDVKVSVINVDRPLSAQQQTELRDQIQALQPKAAADPAVRQQLVTLRARLGDSLQRNRNPVLGDRVTLDVTIAEDAEPGLRHLRLRTPAGLSNPIVFAVGQLQEVRERDVKLSRADAELPVTLPVTVNGRLIPGDVDNVRQPLRQPTQYMPGDVDRYRFTARTGQQLVVIASARDLMPYLADAVPGWLQAVVTMYDAAGHEVAYCDDYDFRPDPVLHFEVPADGEYVVEVRDAIFRGREDFVYRVSIGELPFIKYVFPLGGAAGSRTTVELAGWNLPAKTMTVNAVKNAGPVSISARRGAVESNRLPFDIDTLPEKLEREPNNARTDAQAVTLGTIVDGRVSSPGDADVFTFSARAGDVVVAEVLARSLGSPLDSVIEITDARGRRIARSDDQEKSPDGLSTHFADAYSMPTLPVGGTYFIRLLDAQRKGGPEYGYRLRLSKPRPDFTLQVSPSTVNAVNSANGPIAVTAFRRDGFAGDISLSLKDAPGFTLVGGLIPSGQDRAVMTITAPAIATAAIERIHIEGRATIQGRTVAHTAEPADDRQQAFAYHHLVATDELRASVTGRGGTRVPLRMLTPVPVRIPAGGAARVQISLPAAFQAFENLQFELGEPPDGLTAGAAVEAPGRAGASFELRAGPKASVGLRGNLIVVMTGERIPPANAQGQAARRRVPIAVLPAVMYEVIK